MLFFVFTVPSAGPASVTAGTVTVNSITVQWEEVPCLHRNGEITGYTVVANASGEDERVLNVNGGNTRSVTISGLTPSTQYTVLVAAVNGGPATTIDIATCKYKHVVERHTVHTLDWECVNSSWYHSHVFSGSGSTSNWSYSSPTWSY